MPITKLGMTLAAVVVAAPIIVGQSQSCFAAPMRLACQFRGNNGRPGSEVHVFDPWLLTFDGHKNGDRWTVGDVSSGNFDEEQLYITDVSITVTTTAHSPIVYLSHQLLISRVDRSYSNVLFAYTDGHELVRLSGRCEPLNPAF
jgi:hypothetical protein